MHAWAHENFLLLYNYATLSLMFAPPPPAPLLHTHTQQDAAGLGLLSDVRPENVGNPKTEAEKTSESRQIHREVNT